MSDTVNSISSNGAEAPMQSNEKQVWVSEDTHTQLKVQATLRRMNMRDYVQWLLDKDKEVLNG